MGQKKKCQYPVNGQGRCSRCKDRKPESEFGKHGDGIAWICKACKKIVRKAWYQKHKEEQKARVRSIIGTPQREDTIAKHKAKLLGIKVIIPPEPENKEPDWFDDFY